MVSRARRGTGTKNSPNAVRKKQNRKEKRSFDTTMRRDRHFDSSLIFVECAGLVNNKEHCSLAQRSTCQFQ